MRLSKMMLATVLTVILLISLCLPAAAVSNTEYLNSSGGASAIESEVLKLVNKNRMQNGLQPLALNRKMQTAAYKRATELARSFRHIRPNGSDYSTALTEAGLPHMANGENIASGQTSASKVMSSWMGSPGHRANILRSGYNAIGIGHYYSKSNYWVQLFADFGSIASVSLSSLAGTYTVGTSIDSMGLVLTVVWSNGETGTLPVIAEMCSGYVPTSTDPQTVTVRYQGTAKTFSITLSGGSNQSPVTQRPGTTYPNTGSTNMTRPNTTTLTPRPATGTSNVYRPSTGTSNVYRPSTGVSNVYRPSTGTSNVYRPSTGTSNIYRPSRTIPTLNRPINYK